MGIRRWSDSDISILRAQYPSAGSRIPHLLQKFTRESIKAKAENLSIKHEGQGDKIVHGEKTYLSLKAACIAEGISYSTAQYKKYELGCSSQEAFDSCLNSTAKFVPWTDAEDVIVREHYGEEGYDILKSLPGRTMQAVKRRAYDLKVTGESSRPWTEEEIAILREHYATKSPKELVTLLPGRTEVSIAGRARKLNLSRLTPETISRYNTSIKAVGHTPYGLLYLCCKECGNQYLLSLEEAKEFSHKLCSALKPVPDGWYTTIKSTSLK